MLRCLCAAALLGLACGAAAEEPLLGTRVPEWSVTRWVNSPPLKLEDLRGRPVLIRWFTGSHCPHCSATAPALRQLQRSHPALQVIGLYHHKSAQPFDEPDVRRLAKDYGFTFPVGIDDDWRTLREWWLDTGERDWTSVTFLLDPQGRVRFIHPGGTLRPGDDSFRRLEEIIREMSPRRSSVGRGSVPDACAGG